MVSCEYLVSPYAMVSGGAGVAMPMGLFLPELAMLIAAMVIIGRYIGVLRAYW